MPKPLHGCLESWEDLIRNTSGGGGELSNQIAVRRLGPHSRSPGPSKVTTCRSVFSLQAGRRMCSTVPGLGVLEFRVLGLRGLGLKV